MNMHKLMLLRAADHIEENIIEAIAESHQIGRPLVSRAVASLNSIKYLQEAREACL